MRQISPVTPIIQRDKSAGRVANARRARSTGILSWSVLLDERFRRLEMALLAILHLVSLLMSTDAGAGPIGETEVGSCNGFVIKAGRFGEVIEHPSGMPSHVGRTITLQRFEEGLMAGCQTGREVVRLMQLPEFNLTCCFPSEDLEIGISLVPRVAWQPDTETAGTSHPEFGVAGVNLSDSNITKDISHENELAIFSTPSTFGPHPSGFADTLASVSSSYATVTEEDPDPNPDYGHCLFDLYVIPVIDLHGLGYESYLKPLCRKSKGKCRALGVFIHGVDFRYSGRGPPSKAIPTLFNCDDQPRWALSLPVNSPMI
jgi:hypothetical protein